MASVVRTNESVVEVPGTGDSHSSVAQFGKVLARSLSWTAKARAIASIGNAVRYFVFARLLGPFDFGAVGAALSVSGMLMAVTSPGFEQALVQQDDEVAPYMDTVWLTTTTRGVLLTLLLILLAPAFARFFRQDEAYRVFWGIAPLPLIAGLQSPAIALLYRKLEFRTALVLNTVELLTSFAFGAVGILWWHDWRGLVAGTLAGQVARTALSHWYFPYRLRMRFDPKLARRMFAFGRWVSLSTMLGFAAWQLDNLVVAHLLGPRILGEYQLAFRVGELPGAELGTSIALVTFPLVARLKGRKVLLHRLFVFTNLVLLGAGAGYAIILFNWGDEMTQGVFGAQWAGAVVPMKILCLYGLFEGILALGTSFLDGFGVPSWTVRVTLIRAGTLAAAIYPLTLSHGSAGAALAAICSVIVPLPLMLRLYRRGIVLGSDRFTTVGRSLRSEEQ